MKRLTHLAAGLVLASSGLLATTASAEVSYNIGWASEYYYRGIMQKNSAASAGIDWEDGGFYAGSWAVDVGDGT
ncbi:MAG: TorF family putative porin, partial [Gammaproteobacteria bacterium]|nr:TorF family putative porin [Gammaproteobacteria bacterium]